MTQTMYFPREYDVHFVYVALKYHEKDYIEDSSQLATSLNLCPSDHKVSGSSTEQRRISCDVNIKHAHIYKKLHANAFLPVELFEFLISC